MKIKPRFPHQTQSLKIMAKTPIVFDMSDPGTAKTRVQLDAFDARRGKACKTGEKKMLVLAPKSLLRNAWGDDAQEFVPHLKVSIAYAANRASAFAENADIYITNIDAVNWLATQKPAFFDNFIMIVVDESTAIKHHTSGRSRALDKIKRYFKYRSALTGTPNSNGICDVWNQAYFLDNGKRLGQSFYQFRDACCEARQVGPKAQMIKWTDRVGAEETVASLLADITIRHEFDKVMEVPPTSYFERKYYPTPKQLKAYLQMEQQALSELKTGKVTAINEAAVRTKLLQIASGAVYSSPDTYHVIDLDRYDLVMDLVEQTKHSLVFYLWKHQRDEMVRQAAARKLKYCVFDGDATDKEREQMKKAYQAGFYQVMFAHPKSAAHGLTLTKGTRTIWPSPTDDLEWWMQGNRRQRRAGQTEKTEVIVILADGTKEKQIHDNMCLGKGGRMTTFLEWFAEAA